jgi:iduronate 2-sulfatase
MHLKIYGYTLTVICAFLFLTDCATKKEDIKKYNVLFITIDDLRPQLGCFGDPVVQSPNIDKLASEGLVFKRAYCQQALCGPSRASFLTGYRPETIGVTDLHTHIRDVVPNVITLPQLFKNNGYESVGLFKVFHLVGFDPKGFGNLNDPESWSIPLWMPSRSAWGPYGDSIFQANYRECLKKGPIGYNNIPRSLAFEAPNVEDSLTSDGETAVQAIRYLRQLKDTSFFLAVGFYKPHLPYVAPKKYWDLYDVNALKLPDNQYPPEGSPTYAVVGTGGDRELRSYVNIPDEGKLSDEIKKNLLHGYLASISYVDAQVGLLLAELDKLGLREKTIIVIMGDHGYQIGEHNMWSKKHTNFEISTHAPLIISVPDRKKNIKTESLVEYVDIYPTLAELCDLQAPADLDGSSLVSLFDKPDQNIKEAAFSMYPRGKRIGTTMKTDRYRFTEWKHVGQGETEYELYDHLNDPQENINVVNKDSILKKEMVEKFKKLKPLL